MKKIVKNATIYLLLIFASFALVFFNTSLSPLYNPTYITHDASVFYVIGRGMKEGLLPYKDLFDHKGIYIYFLYYIAALLGENNQIGLYIVFSVLTSIFSITVFNIVSHINKKLIPNIFTTILLTILSLSMYFSHGALLCEYVALVTITISIYITIKDIYSSFSFSPIFMLYNGILCAINIFCKANYALYFVGLGVFVLYNLLIVRKDIKLLIKNIFYGLFGLLIGFLPGLIYCFINGIMSDMLFSVFTFNFSYVDDLNVDLPEEITTKGEAFVHCIKTYLGAYLCIIVSTIILFYKWIKENKDKIIGKCIFFYIATCAFLSISVFMALSAYSHYLTVVIPYFIPFLIVIFNGLEDIYSVKKLSKVLYIVIACLSLSILSYAIGGNYLRMNFDTTAVEERKIKKEMSKYTRLNKNSNILCFGLGSSIYNYLGVLPKEKYFYMPGISYTKFTMPVKSLVTNVKEFKSKIVYYATNKMVVGHFGDEVLNFLEENYVKVMDLSEYKKIYVRKDVYEDREDE